MTKLTAFLLTAAPAMAHPGHFAPADGHDHYAVIAGVVIVGVAFWFALKRRA